MLVSKDFPSPPHFSDAGYVLCLASSPVNPIILPDDVGEPQVIRKTVERALRRLVTISVAVAIGTAHDLHPPRQGSG
jgi:hypothetical protein